MMHREVICNDCGCLLPTSKEMREKLPHKCWYTAHFGKTVVGAGDTGSLPDSDNPHDDPFYEWPEPT